jgi:hypothetical protein
MSSYESTVTVPSSIQEGVQFTIAKISFGRRMELMRRVRDIASKFEFLKAGNTDADQMDARILSAEIDRLYVTWALNSVSGLEIDGEPATPESLALSGPEELFNEALEAVKAECGLTESERKN